MVYSAVIASTPIKFARVSGKVHSRKFASMSHNINQANNKKLNWVYDKVVKAVLNVVLQ